MTELHTNPFEVGDWARWRSDLSVKEGEVVVKSGPSVVIRWLGGGDQVFPVVEYARLEKIDKPRRANAIDRDTDKKHWTVRRTAAVLGVEPKRVRAMLRSGKLIGTHRNGKWTSVDKASVLKLGYRA